MNITPAQREQVRLCILRYCLWPTGASLICANLRAEGFRGVTRDQVDAEIEYLADPDKAFLRPSEKPISPEVRTYRTTATGRDYLAIQNQEAP